MAISFVVKKQTYFDSVTLMLTGSQIKKLPDIENAVVGMCTDYNIDSLKRLNLYQPQFDSLTPNDLIICVSAKTQEAADNGIKEVENRLASKKKASSTAELAPTSQESAFNRMPDANVVLISVPGEYAAREAEIALNHNKHVMLFSDNVTIEQEKRLKEIGEQKNLLVMGPDCGTAIINGTPLAFSNAVRKGDIGLVAASGTGLQEVTSTIHRLGCGVSQAIGVGGRDLSEKIGGKMTLMAAKALANDPETKVIVLISKPPAESVLNKLYDSFKNISKAMVIYFIGADPREIKAKGFVAADNLEDAAIKACDLSDSSRRHEPEYSDSLIKSLASGVKMEAPFIRGLYSGGTLCDEAQRTLLPAVSELCSNSPVRGAIPLRDAYKSVGSCILDLGDDMFTRGKAHPMIDADYRAERMVQEMADDAVGMIIFDDVIGYGSNPDMATEMVEAIKRGAKKCSNKIIFACCICGTYEDPQNYKKQKDILEEAGVYVFPTNISMLKFAKYCLKKEK